MASDGETRWPLLRIASCFCCNLNNKTNALSKYCKIFYSPKYFIIKRIPKLIWLMTGAYNWNSDDAILIAKHIGQTYSSYCLPFFSSYHRISFQNLSIDIYIYIYIYVCVCVFDLMIAMIQENVSYEIQSVRLFNQSQRENRWILDFLRGIGANRNANIFVQDLNSGYKIHFQGRQPLRYTFAMSFISWWYSQIKYESISYLPNPSARAGYDTRSIFKRSLTGFNSEFSFS